jgi:hypothetical protein
MYLVFVESAESPRSGCDKSDSDTIASAVLSERHCYVARPRAATTRLVLDLLDSGDEPAPGFRRDFRSDTRVDEGRDGRVCHTVTSWGAARGSTESS